MIPVVIGTLSFIYFADDLPRAVREAVTRFRLKCRRHRRHGAPVTAPTPLLQPCETTVHLHGARGVLKANCIRSAVMGQPGWGQDLRTRSPRSEKAAHEQPLASGGEGMYISQHRWGGTNNPDLQGLRTVGRIATGG